MTAQAAVQNLFQSLGIPNLHSDFTAANAMLSALLGVEHAYGKLAQAMHQQGRTITTNRLSGLSITLDARENVEVVFANSCGEQLLVLRENRAGQIFLYVGKLHTSYGDRGECPPVQIELTREQIPEDGYASDIDLAIEGLSMSQTTYNYWPEVSAAFGAVYDAHGWKFHLPARLASCIANARSLIAERLKALAHA